MEDELSGVLENIEYADSRYGPFTSSHEGFGVLVEEMSELTEAIRKNNLEGIRTEAIQVSAVALRLAICCNEPSFRERSVK